MRIGSVSGIAGRGDSSLIRPVPDAETLPTQKGPKFGLTYSNTGCMHVYGFLFELFLSKHCKGFSHLINKK